MPPKRGTVVCVKAGRDKTKFMVVLSCDGFTAVVCDGKQRSVENPKTKNLKHIALTCFELTDEQMKTNRSIRHALSDFKANNVKGEI
jgi:ribosomal protein L14E/L6E/L27E